MPDCVAGVPEKYGQLLQVRHAHLHNGRLVVRYGAAEASQSFGGGVDSSRSSAGAAVARQLPHEAGNSAGA